MTQGPKAKERGRTPSNAQTSKKPDAEKNHGEEEEKSRSWLLFKKVSLVAAALAAVFGFCDRVYYESYGVHLAPAAWNYLFGATQLDGQFAIMRARANPDDLRPIEAVFKEIIRGEHEDEVVRKTLVITENKALLRLLKHSTDEDIVEYLKKLGL